MHVTFLKTIFLIFLASLLAVLSARGQADSLGSLEGRVVDAQTQLPVPGALISLESIAKGQPIQQHRIGPTGAFRFTLLQGKGYYVQTEYYIRTTTPGYLSTKEKFIITSGYTTRLSNKIIYLKKGVDPPAEPTRQPVSATVQSPASTTPTAPPMPTVVASVSAAALPPAPVSRTGTVTRPAPAKVAVVAPVTAGSVQTQLRTVRFVQSRAELLPDAQPALDQLLTYMRENPAIRIELAGHTDNQGNFEENLKLSRQRVDLVKAFLVTNGVATSRVSSRGYGSSRPIASNNSEETRRLNRRVEMTVLPN